VAAEEHVFGLVLVNDWSARDIQAWEYQPLGPFLAKNFGTSVSPWVVPLEALEPFRTAGPVQDPRPLPYLQTNGKDALDIHLEVWIQGEKMERPHVSARATASICTGASCSRCAPHSQRRNLQPGDLLASGTISGPGPELVAAACWSCRAGRSRSRSQRGDAAVPGGRRPRTMTGWCQGQGYRVGFGEVTGRILPAGS
jgi:fumarylacetoacetase